MAANKQDWPTWNSCCMEH